IVIAAHTALGDWHTAEEADLPFLQESIGVGAGEALRIRNREDARFSVAGPPKLRRERVVDLDLLLQLGDLRGQGTEHVVTGAVPLTLPPVTSELRVPGDDVVETEVDWLVGIPRVIQFCPSKFGHVRKSADFKVRKTQI